MCKYVYMYIIWVYLQGVLSAIPLMFIMPAACFLKLSPGRWFHSEKLLPSALLLAGAFLVLSGLVLTGLFPQDCSHGDQPSYCPNPNPNVSTTLLPAGGGA